MGTNYYFTRVAAPKDPIHIGKSSAGWCFGLHVTGEIKSLGDWIELWGTPGTIKDEYGRCVAPIDMIAIITDRSFANPHSEDFWRSNQAVPGPRGLARNKVSQFCIGHGPGTWDLLVGEFS